METGKEKGAVAPTTTPNTNKHTRSHYTPDFEALATIIRDDDDRAEFIEIFCQMDAAEHDPDAYFQECAELGGLDSEHYAALTNDYSRRALRLALFMLEYPGLPPQLVEQCGYYIATATDYSTAYYHFYEVSIGERNV